MNINKLDGQYIFLCLATTMLALWMFYNMDIRLNIVVGMFCMICIIGYLSSNKQTNNTKAKNTEQHYEPSEIAEFFQNIKHLYTYNPLAYANMTNAIRMFFVLSRANDETIYINYEKMDKLKRNALNNLHSLFLSISFDKNMVFALNNSITKLNTILTKYLTNISNACKQHTATVGYNVNTKIITNEMIPHNTFDDIFAPYTFEIY